MYIAITEKFPQEVSRKSETSAAADTPMTKTEAKTTLVIENTKKPPITDDDMRLH